MRSAALVLLLGLSGAPALAAVPLDIHGRFELADTGAFARGDSLDAVLRARNRNDLLANVRLIWEPSWDRWSVAIHYVATLDDGDGVRLLRAEAGLLPAPPSTWFNLTEHFVDHGQVSATQAIDRLSVAYTAPDFVVRIGRQALTWGSGLVFRPMDLFDPFPPNATDTEYKPGIDMVYAQWLFANGADLQLIVVPRPARVGAQPSSNASSIALHLQASVLGHEVTGLLARDHGDVVAGASLNGSLAGATWNVELVPTILDRGGTRLSALANISDAVTLFGRNATLFAEYFHNGFGADADRFSLATLPPELLDRLARGQVFNTRRDYLASGMTWEIDPLLNVSPTLIANFNNASLYALVAATRSLGDNLSLIAGAQAAIGPRASEFGGMPLTPGSKTVLAPPLLLYVQLRRYF